MRNWKRRISERVIGFLQYHGRNGSIERLRETGLRIGEGTVIKSCYFDELYPWIISIGNSCTLTHCTILAHDDSSILFLSKRYVAPVQISDRVFVGFGAIILPGVTIGSNSIVGAGAVVTKDVPEGSVVTGNPANVIGRTEEMCGRRVSKNRLIPYELNNNLVTQDDALSVLVRSWANSGFSRWPEE